jgi:hypothetical protein
MSVETVDEAIVAKLTWRHPVMVAYTRALIARALALLEAGVVFFNNDDVAEEDQPGDGTTVGSVIRQLLDAHILEPWRGSLPDAGIWGGMRKSSRRECHGHRNQLYTLTNRGLAEAWLRRHGAPVAVHQEELALA